MAGEEQESKENMEESSPELVIKHPLQHKWSLWFYKNDKNKAWEENLLEITSFDTVEDFWALYNHIEVASKMPIGCDYSLFKYGIKPMWEDDRNKQGGRWLINIGKHLRNSDLDNYWLETLLCLIGEAFDECSDDVCGAVVQVRAKSDKIGVWTADVKNTEYNIKIGFDSNRNVSTTSSEFAHITGKKLKERLNIHRGVLGYEAHADTQTKTGSVAKCRYQV